MHSLTFALATMILLAAKFASGAPAPWKNEKSTPSIIQEGNAYSGAGGQAPGGSVNMADGSLLNILTGNAGSGGQANSGDAYARRHYRTYQDKRPGSSSDTIGNAYSGPGGQASGGNVIANNAGSDRLGSINLLSFNAGNDGQASSGSSVAGTVASLLTPLKMPN